MAKTKSRLLIVFITFVLLLGTTDCVEAADPPQISVTPRAAELSQPDLTFTITITNSTFPPNPTVFWNEIRVPTAVGANNTQIVVTLLPSDVGTIPKITPVLTAADISGTMLKVVGGPNPHVHPSVYK